MSRTFKMCTIYFLSAVWVVLIRILFSYLNLSDNVSNWLFSFIVQVIGFGIIPMLLYRYWAKEKISCLVRAKTKVSASVIIIAVVLGFLLRHISIAVSSFWQNFIQLLGFTSVNSSGTIYSSPEVFWLDLICTALFPAVFEEIVHRGLLQDALYEIESDRSKIFIMAIMFGLMHQNINQVVYTFVGGLVMAYLAVKTGSLIPSMIVHFINNAFSVIYSYSYQNNGLFNYYYQNFYNFLTSNVIDLVITRIVAVVLIYLLLEKVKRISAKNRKDSSLGRCGENKENIYNFKANTNIGEMDSIFGYSTPTNTIRSKSKWYEYAFIYGTVFLTAATTIITFIWGYLR